MIKTFKTELEYKDLRQYVHSTTLVEKFTQLVLCNISSKNTWQKPKLDAQFHKEINCNGKFKLTDEDIVLGEVVSPSANFLLYDNYKKITAIFVEDKNWNVIKRINSNFSIHGTILKSEFSGECVIDCSNQRAMIENIIEANKIIHLKTLGECGNKLNVLNLFMRNYPIILPKSKGIDERNVLLRIDNNSSRSFGNSVVTLNSFYFPDVNLDRFEISYLVKGIDRGNS